MAKVTGTNSLNKAATQKATAPADLSDRIRKKAQEIWEKKGRVQGQDLAIWLEAEKLVKSGKA